jgi:ABC-type polysaccharide/polyol phosphate transport system ATPase subunit
MVTSALHHVWKKYRYPEKKILLRDLLGRAFRRIGPQNNPWVLSDVTFEIKQGESVGMVGRNGSGKTTLLKLLCRALVPTRGSVTVKGRVVGVLDLGSGFHPDLTGLENTYLNGLFLGISRRRMTQLLPAIEEFSGLNHFLERPVRTYSTGMILRLAFAIACHAEGDLFLADDALAVGDLAFQEKCLQRLQQFREEGKTLLLVSQNLPLLLTLCERGLLLEKGSIQREGRMEEEVKKSEEAKKQQGK